MLPTPDGLSVVISDAAATPAVSMKRWNAFRMSFSDALLLWRSTTRPNASCSLLVVIASLGRLGGGAVVALRCLVGIV